MYYEVVATDVDISQINRIAHEGMKREAFDSALRELQR
jgi:hypothetical protein